MEILLKTACGCTRVAEVRDSYSSQEVYIHVAVGRSIAPFFSSGDTLPAPEYVVRRFRLTDSYDESKRRVYLEDLESEVRRTQTLEQKLKKSEAMLHKVLYEIDEGL